MSWYTVEIPDGINVDIIKLDQGYFRCQLELQTWKGVIKVLLYEAKYMEERDIKPTQVHIPYIP